MVTKSGGNTRRVKIRPRSTPVLPIVISKELAARVQVAALLAEGAAASAQAAVAIANDLDQKKKDLFGMMCEAHSLDGSLNWNLDFGSRELTLVSKGAKPALQAVPHDHDEDEPAEEDEDEEDD